MNLIEIYKRALERERKARKQAEKIIEQKSYELYTSNTELKRINKSIEAEVKLRTNELNDLFDNMYDGYVQLDLDGNIQKSNKAARRILGYPDEQEIKALSLKDIVHEDDKAKSKLYIDKLINDGYYSEYVGRIYDKYGNIKYIEVNSNATYNTKNEIVGTRDIIRDVTNRILAEEQLRLQEKKYRNIIDNMNLGLLEVNLNNEILYANQRFLEMSEYTLKDLKNKKADDLFVIILHPKQPNAKQINFALKKSMVQELKIITKNGNENWWLISSAPNYDDNQNQVGTVGICLDITNQKMTQKKLKTSIHQLEQANKDLKDFAHVVSHDLKSPLRSISGLIQILQEDYAEKFDAEGQQIVEDVIKRTEHMDDLIGGILAYSSVQSDEKKNVYFSSKEIIDNLLNFIEMPPNIQFKIEGNFPNLKMNITHFQQIIQNLLTNAIKYNDKERGEIMLSASQDNHYNIFKIEDNGQGIDPKNQNKIFDMFQKFDAEGKTSSGIGLAVVQKIVGIYKGKITLTSVKGTGATFTVYIPK